MGKIRDTFGQVCAVIGCQWGDEGKGKIIDLFADEYDIIVRATGGANAGHSIYYEKKTRGKHRVYEKFVFHLIPSGMLHPKKLCVIGNGMVIHFPTLFEEIEVLKRHGVKVEGRLFISLRAHIVFEYHKILDRLQEEQKGMAKIGTTGRGIGPAYAEKTNRTGIRVADLQDFELFKRKFLHHVKLMQEMYNLEYDPREELNFFKTHRAKILRYAVDTASFLNEAYQKGKSILLEGANGTLLDIDHGTYPYVTSSNASIGGLMTGSGLPPTAIKSVIGIMKAYTTRVGGGPFPTELKDRLGDQLREQGDEYGATTGRPRRCGWFDAFAARYSAMINGITAVNLTKLDVLTGFPKLLIGTHYYLGRKKLSHFPSSIEDLERCRVEYLELPGWNEELGHITRFSDLPRNCQRYVETIEKLIGAPIRFLGTGLTRKHMIER